MKIIYPIDKANGTISGWVDISKKQITLAPGEVVEVLDEIGQRFLKIYSFCKEIGKEPEVKVEELLHKATEEIEKTEMTFAQKRDLLKTKGLFKFGLKTEQIDQLIKTNNLSN